MFYRLVPIIDNEISVRVGMDSGKGYNRYGHITLQPNKTYDTEGDKVLENSLREFQVKKVYTKQLEELLTNNNIPFEEKICPACGGKKKNIFYNPVEVFE